MIHHGGSAPKRPASESVLLIIGLICIGGLAFTLTMLVLSFATERDPVMDCLRDHGTYRRQACLQEMETTP